VVGSIADRENGKREVERETKLSLRAVDRALSPRSIERGRVGRTMNILLVEDNEHDIFFVHEALKRLEKPIELTEACA
jgi:hypothetical protein